MTATSKPLTMNDDRQHHDEHEHDDDDAGHATVFYPTPGPRLHLHRARRAAARRRRWQSAPVGGRRTPPMYTSFIERVVAHVSEEHGRLHDVGERRAVRLELCTQVGDRLAELGFEPAGHELAVDDARPGRTRRASPRRARLACTGPTGLPGLRSLIAVSTSGRERRGAAFARSTSAAATAANTASLPLRGGPSSSARSRP